MTNQQLQAKEAHDRREEIVKLRQATGKDMVALAKELYLAQCHKDCQALGFETFEQLVAAPLESGGYELTNWTASKLITIWKHYVVGKICTGANLEQTFEIKKLYEGRKYLTTPQEFEERIHLSCSDIEKEGKGVNDVECSHQNIREIMAWKCQDCGYSWREDPRLREITKNDLSEQIDKLIETFKEKTGMPALSEGYKESRKWAAHLLKRYSFGDILECLEWLLEQTFWQANLSKMKQLYYQMPRYQKEPTEAKAQWVEVKPKR